MNKNNLYLALLCLGAPALSFAQPANNNNIAVGEKSPAPRHGTPSQPISRQQLCYNGGNFHWPPDGANIPDPACKAAYQHIYNKYKDKFDNDQQLIEQSNYLFIQKDEYSKLIPDYNNQDKVKEAIPDGQLCSGGNVGTEKDSKKDYLWNDKSGMDVATHWTASNVKLNDKGEIDIVYHTTASHPPTYFEVYLSNADYKASERPLKWSDLTLLKKVTDPTLEEPDYKFSVPANNAKGERVLFIRWQRIDPAGEGFYSCSDINIQ